MEEGGGSWTVSPQKVWEKRFKRERDHVIIEFRAFDLQGIDSHIVKNEFQLYFLTLE